MVVEIFIIIILVIWFIIWLVRRKPRDKSLGDLEARLGQEYHEKEKEYIERLHQQELSHAAEIALIEKENNKCIKGYREDAVKRSRNSLLGKLWEHVAPFLPKFKYNPADMRFIGCPIDYVIFKGMNKKKIEEVIFLEIKSGDSKLNEQEECLKRAIKAKRVKWEEFRIPNN